MTIPNKFLDDVIVVISLEIIFLIDRTKLTEDEITRNFTFSTRQKSSWLCKIVELLTKFPWLDIFEEIFA